MKKKFLVGLVLVIGIGVVGVACTGGSSSTNGSGNTTSSADKKPAVTNEKKEYKVGDEVDVDGTKIKVDEVNISQGGEYDKPKDGNEFVIVKLTITNSSNENISYNPFDYSIKNSSGQITTAGITIVDNDTRLSSGQLAAGGSVTGTIAFEAPKGDTGLKLLYKSNMFDDKIKAEINLN